MKLYYKALFEKEEEGGYTVTFSDIEETVTYGKTLEEAIEMAKECLGMRLETRTAEGEGVPKATEDDIYCPENCFIMLIEFDPIEYYKSLFKSM